MLAKAKIYLSRPHLACVLLVFITFLIFLIPLFSCAMTKEQEGPEYCKGYQRIISLCSAHTEHLLSRPIMRLTEWIMELHQHLFPKQAAINGGAL